MILRPHAREKHRATTPHASTPHSTATTATQILQAWHTSRQHPAPTSASPNGYELRAGVPRSLTLKNIRIALFLLSQCWLDVLRIVLGLHPIRMPLMVICTLLRGILPAYQTYSQASILDEIQKLVASGQLRPRWDMPLVHLLLWELGRTILIRLFESYVDFNATTVQQSVRLHFEYLQLQNRLRLDIPALADPLVQDLLDESNRFVNAFNAIGSGSNTILTPLGLVGLLGDISQAASQAFLLYQLLFAHSSSSLSIGSTSNKRRTEHIMTAGLIIVLPKLPSILRRIQSWTLASADDWPDDAFSRKAATIKRRITQMENMAYSVTYKAEIVLFGLADWVLDEWMKATREDMELDKSVNARGVFTANNSESRARDAMRSLANDVFDETANLLRNVPLILQFANYSLGTVSITRSAVERLSLSCTSIRMCVRWSFDAAFDLGAFHCAMNMRPYMEAKPGPEQHRVNYEETRIPGKRGMKIELKDLSFVFPGHIHPTLDGINLQIAAGETIAIVGLNGSGKTSLLHVLARLVDFSSGELRINDVDSRTMDAAALHERTSAVFQSFCKFEHTSVRENTGMGDVATLSSSSSPSLSRTTSTSSSPTSPVSLTGCNAIHSAHSESESRSGMTATTATTTNTDTTDADERIWQALRAAGAGKLVETFDNRLETLLEGDGHGMPRHLHTLQHYDHPPPPYASNSTGGNGNGNALQPYGFHSIYGSSSPSSSPTSPTVSDKQSLVSRLSGGQWQRIAIARALMRKDTYDLMLIDEANSALDARGQRELFQGLVDQPNHGTIIFVTHRLEALRYADKVAVVEDGRITAFGTPDETFAQVHRVFELSKDE